MKGSVMNRQVTPEAVFHRALLDPQHPVPDGLYVWNGSDPTERFDVYRNNVVVSLIEALESGFDVVRQLVGDQFFRAMAREFLRNHPPESPVLAYFGEDFPEFIAHFEPAASLPYLADTARIEWLRVQAYHAADAEPLSLRSLQHVLAQPERLPMRRLTLHPSVRIIRSDYAVVSLWAAHQGLMPLNRVDPVQPEAALILRPELEVEVVPIDDSTALFAVLLQQDCTLGEALESTLSHDAEFNLDATLITLFKRQALTAIE